MTKCVKAEPFTLRQRYERDLDDIAKIIEEMEASP